MLTYHCDMSGRLIEFSLIDYCWHISNCSSKGSIFCDWVLGGEDQFTKAVKTEALRHWWGWPMDSLWYLWRYVCLLTFEWTTTPTTPGSFLILQQHELNLVLLYNTLLIIKHVFFSAWALKKGFLTAKAARPDAYRAANHLLRMALIGRICLCLRPPGYSADEGKVVVYLKLIKNLCTTELRTFIQYTGLKFKYWFWFYCNTGNQYSVKT